MRAMERSRRATNLQNYNPDGTIRKGYKQWKFSKRYGKLRQKYQELCRIAAENRTFAIREQVNHLRTLGDCFVTEPANAKKLQKRANPEVKTDKNSRMKRKKRFGRSIKNRCPGYMQAKAKQLIETIICSGKKDFELWHSCHVTDRQMGIRLSIHLRESKQHLIARRERER